MGQVQSVPSVQCTTNNASTLTAMWACSENLHVIVNSLLPPMIWSLITSAESQRLNDSNTARRCRAVHQRNQQRIDALSLTLHCKFVYVGQSGEWVVLSCGFSGYRDAEESFYYKTTHLNHFYSIRGFIIQQIYMGSCCRKCSKPSE